MKLSILNCYCPYTTTILYNFTSSALIICRSSSSLCLCLCPSFWVEGSLPLGLKEITCFSSVQSQLEHYMLWVSFLQFTVWVRHCLIDYIPFTFKILQCEVISYIECVILYAPIPPLPVLFLKCNSSRVV